MSSKAHDNGVATGMSVQSYYGERGSYIKDHRTYFSHEHLVRDIRFITKALRLTKSDRCLDLQCAQGRLTVALAEQGFCVDGVDASAHMLYLARKAAHENGLDVQFFKQDIQRLQLPKIYTKASLFFPDWTTVDAEQVLFSVSGVMRRGGLFLYDQDNLFRIWSYLSEHPKAKFSFDPLAMELRERNEKHGTRYFVFTELRQLFERAGFSILKTYGGWDIRDGAYTYRSPRLRIIAKKR